MVKKFLGIIALLLACSVAFCQNLAVHFLVADPGQDASSEVGINWHCNRPGSILEVREASDQSFENAQRYCPAEEVWSLSQEFVTRAEPDSVESLFCDSRYVCSVNLSGLKAGCSYQYRVVLGNECSEVRNFTTASGAKEWKFVAFTDFQPAHNDKTHAIIEKVRSLAGADVPLAVCSGDMIDYSSAEQSWRWLLDNEIFGRFLFASSPGDHEYWAKGTEKHIPQLPKPLVYNRIFNNPRNGFEERLNSSFFFHYNNVLFVALDMADSNTPRTSMFEREAEWFSQVVESRKGTYDYLVVMEHKGIFGSYTNDSGVAKYMRPLWAPVFRKAGVDLVLCGHDHMFSRSVSIGGTYYLDMGTSGKKVRTPDEGLYNDGLHELVLDLKASGQCMGAVIDVGPQGMQVWVYELDGTLIDSFTIAHK